VWIGAALAAARQHGVRARFGLANPGPHPARARCGVANPAAHGARVRVTLAQTRPHWARGRVTLAESRAAPGLVRVTLAEARAAPASRWSNHAVGRDPATPAARVSARADPWMRTQEAESSYTRLRQSPMNTPVWMEIELTLDADKLQVSARGSRMERVQHRSNVTLQELEQFTQRVRQAVQRCKRLDADALDQARALHRAILQGEVAELAARLREAAPAGRLLQRLMIQDGRLQAVPWEALCGPDGAEDFWGVKQKTLLARGVDSSEPWEPREIRGAVRLLAIAPSSDERALHNLQRALKDSIDAGEIEWLEPIVGARAGKRHLFEQLRRSQSPHILHFLGHGGVREDQPVLLLGHGGHDEDDDAWVPIEALARELQFSFGEDLRLVVLEACEGAQPGGFGSAAEILARRGADAVVAHLWPVRADVARTCSRQFYQVLAGARRHDREGGDVVASLVAARSTLLMDSAEAFSPVLYLRGSGATIFDFPASRRVSPPRARRELAGPAADLAPALRVLLQGQFSLVLGDNDHRADDKGALRNQVERFLSKHGDRNIRDVSLGVLAQRCLLRFGQETLYELFQDALLDTLENPCPRLVAALARVLGPGVHVTLLWRPLLESALADTQPGRTIHVIQPPLLGGTERPRVLVRAAGEPVWRRDEYVPGKLDFNADIVILRLYGGYLPERRPIFTSAMVTEDDHIHGLIGMEGLRPPAWSTELMAWLRMHSALFAGLSVLEWQHRMLLHWLYDRHPAPRDSVVVLDPAADPVEQDIWQRGGGLPGQSRIAAICQDADALADALDAHALEARP
jgi:CHAT domain-containing protein